MIVPVTAGVTRAPFPAPAVWLRLQRELAAGHENSAFIIAKESAIIFH
jgi:hypothetical protein